MNKTLIVLGLSMIIVLASGAASSSKAASSVAAISSSDTSTSSSYVVTNYTCGKGDEVNCVCMERWLLLHVLLLENWRSYDLQRIRMRHWTQINTLPSPTPHPSHKFQHQLPQSPFPCPTTNQTPTAQTQSCSSLLLDSSHSVLFQFLLDSYWKMNFLFHKIDRISIFYLITGIKYRFSLV